VYGMEHSREHNTVSDAYGCILSKIDFLKRNLINSSGSSNGIQYCCSMLSTIGTRASSTAIKLSLIQRCWLYAFLLSVMHEDASPIDFQIYSSRTKITAVHFSSEHSSSDGSNQEIPRLGGLCGSIEEGIWRTHITI